jgi:hypothetical protein
MSSSAEIQRACRHMQQQGARLPANFPNRPDQVLLGCGIQILPWEWRRIQRLEQLANIP